MPTLQDPIAFELFGFAVRWYAIALLLGIITAIVLVNVLAHRREMDAGFMLDIAPWVVIGGIVGARISYVIVTGDRFLDRPLDALNLRLGGLTIHGAVLAGTTLVWVFCRRGGQSFFSWTDLIMPGVAIGQAIGRWGNWANQEAFGTPTSLPWAVTIAPENRPSAYPDQATFHPTFLYESIANLAIAGVLIWMVLRMPGSTRLREGDSFWTYFLLYGATRLILEAIRTDSVYVGPLPGPTWASLAFIIVGVSMIVARRTVRPGRFIPPLTSAAPRHG